MRKKKKLIRLSTHLVWVLYYNFYINSVILYMYSGILFAFICDYFGGIAIDV